MQCALHWKKLPEVSETRMTRGWKLLLLPRLLLWRPVRGGLVSKKDLELRFRSFQTGQWRELLNNSQDPPEISAEATSPVRRNCREKSNPGPVSCQSGRAVSGMTSPRGASVAPGTHATLRALTDPERRPPMPRLGLSQEIERSEPEHPFKLDGEMLLTCLRKSRRGAAAGPSGMTADHLFPILNERDSSLFVQAATSLARGNIPEVIMEAIRLGQMTALRKPDGGVRGIVVGDIVRQLVARTIAKQEAGCECVAHILQAMTDRDSQATVVSIDGVGAYDLISRNAMLEGLVRMEGGDQILPFVRCFYGSPSTHLWKTRWERHKKSHKEREESRATPSCPCSLLWASIEHWTPFRVACVTARNCLLSSTMSISN